MIDSTPASVAVLAPLASSVAATCGNSHYDRARAATALGRELANLRHVDVKAVREALGDTKELENALLELVGSRQQRLWQEWRRRGDEALPDAITLSVEDARIVRQNCVALLASITTLQSCNQYPPITLEGMKETPSPVVSKRELRSSHVPSVKKKVMERLRNATTGTSLTLVKSALSPRLQVESQVEAALSSQRDMVGSQRRLATFISTLDDKTVTKIPEVYNQSNVIQKSSSAAARNSSRGYLRMLSGAYRAPRSLPGGHRRSVIYLDDQKKNEDDRYDDRHLGYQTSRLLVPRTHPVAHQARPEVSTPLHLAPRLTSALERAKLSATSLTLIEEHRNINSLATYAGTAGLDPGHPHAPDIRAILPNANLPSNTRRLPPLRKMPSRIPLQKFSVPPTTASFVNFNEDTGCDEGDSTKIENGPQITGGTSTANVEAQTQKAVERQRIARAVSDELDMVTPLSPISPVDVRRVLAWSPSTGARNSPSHQRRNDVNFTQAEESNEGKRIPSAWTSVNLTSNKSIQDDHAIHPRTRSGTLRTNSARAQAKQPRSGLQIAAREAKVAWRESRMDVIFQAFHYDNESTIRTSQDISAARNADNILFGEFQQAGDEASKKSVAAMLPMRWITRVSLPQESSSEQFLLQVASVRRRLHRILSRWIEEFEKSQLVVALGLWRIAVWELSREESWVVHRVKSGCAKASSLFQTCQRRSAARAFAKLTTYAGWMMFEERSLAALKFQSAYRRLRAMRVFVWRHDAQPLGGYYADVGLGEIRESLRFRIDDRVRLERRIFWTAATSIQTRQRRNEMFGYYQHARLTATKFASLYRMHVLRRRFLLMRTSATSLEAVVRMLLMKHPYLRLRAATCVAQRMVRGHAGRMRAYSTLFARRRAIERVITAPLKIQSSWRFFIARQRVQRIRILKFREQRACLTLQLAWYRKKGSFATFLLLSCLRVSDEEDVEYAAQVQLLIRKMAARRISIRYRSHLFRRRQASAMRISSCWRAHVAKNHVLKLRKSRWALRKLHALIGVRIKAKHESASKIAIWWWSRRPGRFLRHLQYYASRYERILESEDRRTRKYAAAKIRAVVQGQSTRSWLRREGASLRLQRKWRTKLAYLNARRKREELRMVVASIVAKISMHGAIDFELNARCREFHRHAIRIQAKTRGILARQAMLLAAAVTRSRFLAATQLQRFERRRQRYVDACKQIEMARRRRGSCFKDCETFDDVFALLSKFADLPDAGQDQQNWFWYDIDNAWSGVSAHTVCRRSGHVDTLQVLGDRMISLQELSSLFSNHSPSKSTASVPPSLSQRHVASSSLEVSTLARSIIASSKKGKGGQNKIIDQCEPLTNAGDRHAAALLVCALIYDGLSHRRVESLPSPKDIGSLVKYDKLPYPCRKLVSALSDEHLFANGEAPHDVSRGMMYRFCLGYPDAEKALRALRSRHFGRLPWIPGRTEEHQDLQRVKRSYLVRLDALEHFQYFLERQDPEYARTSFLGATIASALDAANKALEIAYTRQRKRRRSSRRESRILAIDTISEVSIHRNFSEGLATPTKPRNTPTNLSSDSDALPGNESVDSKQTIGPMENWVRPEIVFADRFTKEGMSEYHDGDVHDYFQEFNKACPYESAYISTHGILSVIPGVGRSERAFALAVANVVFSHALEFVRKYVQAAHRISPALKRYVSRLLTSTMRHAHMVSKAKIAYLRERTGEALRMAWQEDMKSYADRQKAEEAAKMRAERRAQIQKSISTILRFGWQRLDIRKGQIQVSLQLSGDENLDRSASVQVFERVRLHKANSVRRTGHSNIMKYYDDDDARDLHVPRVLFDANDGSECERERRRIPPLYEIEDFEASLAIQSRVRSRVARMLLERLRREKRRAARELREREDWERREQERLRHVTVHCDVEIRKSPFFLPYTAEKDITTSHARNQVDDKVKLSLFEPEHASIERGVHVLARFSGTGSKHWFSGTIFDDSRQPEVFGVEFDDGDVDAEVPRINIKIPRISEGDHVQSRVSDADAFVAARVVKVRPSETFDIRYQDGRVEHGIHRSRLKVPHIEEYMEIEAKNDRCRARREVMRAHRLNRERRLQETISASRMQQEKIRHRFIRACSVSPFDTLLQEQDDLDVESSSCVSYASALAEVARCVIETQQLMSPRCIVSVRITYTMVALRFGWSEVEGDQSIGVPYYFHRTSGETTWDRPHYDFQEHTAVRCIQDLVRKYLRRIQLSKALESSHLRALVRRTRDAAAQIAWTPSLQAETREQVPLELWMARRGFYHSAIASVLKCVDKQVRHATGQRKMNEANSTNAKKHALLDARCGVLRRLKRLSGGHFSNCVQRKSSQLSSDVPHEKATATLGSKLHQQQIRDEKLLEGVGLTDAADINWLRTTTDDVDSFIAYWTSSRDTRSMKEVLVNAKTKYTQELEAHYKNQRARCEHMAEILTQSKFPVTQGQLRRLCHDFAGKPAAAQEAINSTLLNVPTTSTRKTEVAALDVFMAGAKRCIQFVRKLRLRTLEVLFEKAFQAAENVRTAQEEDEANEMSSNAARACWILDDEIFSVVTVVLDGVVRHQAYTRRHLTMHKFRILLHARIHAATVCQMAWRSLIARRTLALYKAQQAADWHMLWDDSAQAFYFLQLSTLAVCWEEPEGGEWSYRPQVRDRYSQKLMLAWPQRDQPKALSLQQPSVGKCMVCKIEDSTRRCLSCQAPTFEGSLPIWGDGYFHFCFACFAAHHETSLTMRSHKFEVTKEAIAPPLRCCACNELATRRCRGLRLQPRGHEKLARLFLQHPFSGAANESLDAPHLIALDEKELLASLSGERLRNILRQAGIPLSSLRGEEIHQSCKCVVDKTDNHTDQLASYHTALQDALSKLASECNDVFCESCWSSTHSKGARLKHAWVGFAAGAAICALCEASIAIVKCDTCGDKLCAPCSAATHALGKNRNHQVEIYREEDATTYCGCCDRRQATETCSLCAETFCDSCLLFEHAATCPGRHGATAIAMGIATNYASKCVVCGRKPDTRCVECDELYCTWKGRQRCFGKAHARGKRREHTKVPYRALVDLEERLLQESVEEENRVKAAEERKARTVEENERERQNAIRFQQEKERQIDSKAQDVFVQQLLTEKRDERLPTSRWLRELASLRSAISRSSAIKRRL